MNILDKVISKAALPIIGVAALLLILLIIQDTRDTGTQNNAYIRVINCIISVPAKTRTQQDIDKCYDRVERDLNVDLQRYENK